MAKHRGTFDDERYDLTNFWPGRSHRGIWIDHRYGTNGVLAREYFTLNACPLCWAFSGNVWVTVLALDHAAQLIKLKSHHCYVRGKNGELEGIDVCEEHYHALTKLFWYQMAQR